MSLTLRVVLPWLSAEDLFGRGRISVLPAEWASANITTLMDGLIQDEAVRAVRSYADKYVRGADVPAYDAYMLMPETELPSDIPGWVGGR